MKVIALFVAILFSIGVVSISAQSQVRVKRPASGMLEKTVSGNVKGTNYVDFVVNIYDYEAFEAKLKSVNKKVKLTILKPDGSVFEKGADVREFFDYANDSGTGDYVFRVYVKGGAKRNVKFTLEISAYLPE